MCAKKPTARRITATGGMEAGIAGETTRLTGYLNGDTHTHVTTTHEHHLLYAYAARVSKRILRKYYAGLWYLSRGNFMYAHVYRIHPSKRQMV